MDNKITAAGIKIFFDDLYCFSKEFNSILASEVLRLNSLLGHELSDDFPEVLMSQKESEKHIIPMFHGDTSSVLKHIETENLLLQCPVQTLICSTFDPSQVNCEKYTLYKALSLQVVIRQIINKDVASKSNKLCNEIRQLSLGRRLTLESYLPLIKGVPLSVLVDNLNGLKSNDVLLKDDKTRAQLANYSIAYTAAFEHSTTNKRVHIIHDLGKHLEFNPLMNLDDSADFDASEISEVSDVILQSKPYESEDLSSESDKKLILISIINDNSNAVNSFISREIVSKVKRRDMMLPCDIYAPTQFEISKLIDHCFKSLDTPSGHCAKLLLLSLILGTSTDGIKQLRVVRETDNSIVGIKRTHKLPSQKTSKSTEHITSKVTKDITIILPEYIISNLSNLRFTKVDKLKVKTFLLSINKEYGTHLTEIKIASYLQQKFHNENKSPVIPAIIKGEHLDRLPALYYNQIDINEFNKAYLRHLNYLNHHGDYGPLFHINESILESDKKIGSPLFIGIDELKVIFNELQSRVKNILRLKKKKFSKNAHNYIVIYTQQIIAMSSGYRPVTGWLGKLSDIDLANKQYWISDKETQSVNSSRLIVLSTICIEVIKQYLTYVKQCIRFYKRSDPTLADRYHKILTGEEHLTFFMKSTGNKGKTITEEASPKTIQYHLKDIFPLQLNWYRHHMCSYLNSVEEDPSLIRAWMGHSDFGGNTFTASSSCSFRSMASIANAIDRYLSKIGIEV